MKACWGSGGIVPRILYFGTRWRCGQLHAAAALPPGKQHLVPRGWADPTAGLDSVVKRKIPSPCRDSENLKGNRL
jgi:hypothetical protein